MYRLRLSCRFPADVGGRDHLHLRWIAVLATPCTKKNERVQRTSMKQCLVTGRRHDSRMSRALRAGLAGRPMAASGNSSSRELPVPDQH